MKKFASVYAWDDTTKIANECSAGRMMYARDDYRAEDSAIRPAQEQKQLITQTRQTLNRAQGGSRHSWRLPALGLLAIFAVGVVFGGYLVS